MVRSIQVNNIHVRLFIQKLNGYVSHSHTLELIALDEYICYFKLFPATGTMLGELIRDENKLPKVFGNQEEAEKYALTFLSSKLADLPDLLLI